MAKIFNCSIDNIAVMEDDLNGDILYYYGDLKLEEITNLENIKLPEIINGNLDLNDIKSINLSPKFSNCPCK